MIPVNSHQSPVALERMSVGKAVSSGHWRRVCDDINFLTAHCVHTVINTKPYGVDTSQTMFALYRKTPNIKTLRVLVSLLADDNNALANVTVSLTGATWIQHNGLDGSRDLPATKAVYRNLPVYVGYLDVTGVSSSLQTIQVDVASANGVNVGCGKLFIQEVSLADIDPVNAPTTEPGINSAWCLYPEGVLYEGSSSTPDGFARIQEELANAETKFRQHVQYSTFTRLDGLVPFSTTAAPSFGALANNAGGKLKLRFQPRDLYGTSVSFDFKIYYVCSTGGNLRISVTPVGGSTTNNDFVLSASAFYTSYTNTVSVPVTGTEGEVDIEFLGNVSSAGTLRVAFAGMVKA